MNKTVILVIGLLILAFALHWYKGFKAKQQTGTDGASDTRDLDFSGGVRA